jgi:hypothetical protein
MKDGALFYDQWKSLDSLNGSFDNGRPIYLGICPFLSHTYGHYTWWVRGWSPVQGMGAWSATTSFTIAP